MFKILLHLEDRGGEIRIAELPRVGDLIAARTHPEAEWYEVTMALHSVFHEGTDRDAEIYTRKLSPAERSSRLGEGRVPTRLSLNLS